MRQRLNDFDSTLDQEIERATVIAGQTSDHDPEDKADGNADEPYREGNSAPVNKAREHVAAQPVRAKQEQGSAWRGTEQVEVALKHAPEPIAVAVAKEADGVDHVRFLIFALQRVHIQVKLIAPDIRTDKAAVEKQVDRLRRRANHIGVSRF